MLLFTKKCQSKMSVKSFGSCSSNYARNRAEILKNDAIEEKKKNEQKKSSSLTKSSWTPLGNNTKLNEKLFCERRDLVCNWFDKWNDAQRKDVLRLILDKCSASQRQLIDQLVHPTIPVHNVDFSRILPRCIVVYIFSFLDPRSLCRCARVSWYFKVLSDADECWMPKCINLGWWPSFKVSPMENGVWKRLFVQTIVDLRNGRIPLGNAKYDVVEQEHAKSESQERNETKEKQKKKTEKVGSKNFDPKKNGTQHQHKRKQKIKQLYPLRPTSLSDQPQHRREVSSGKQTEIEEGDDDDGSNLSADKNENKTEDTEDDRPKWATAKYLDKDYKKESSDTKPFGLFLKDIIHDDVKEEKGRHSESPLFSSRPWLMQDTNDDDFDDYDDS